MITTSYKEILEQIDSIDPLKYGTNRNYIDGSVSRLSPYISRGVVSTRYVYERLITKGYDFLKIEKFIQELCWRDYWQLIWSERGEDINTDLKQEQKNVTNRLMPISVLNGKTGIQAIDDAINELYETGYMHNHLRMYVASITCNVAGSHWKNPAKWLYYYLLDADWGSNALSWQWVAGSNSNRKYYANQENINRYCYTNQKNTFLDVDYSKFENLEIPQNLKETIEFNIESFLPKNKSLKMDKEIPTLIYNFYNLDPLWRNNQNSNKILLLEPGIFQKYPVSKKTVEFIIELSKNIIGIQLFVGSFKDLKNSYNLKEIIYKEHPLNKHYEGNKDNRDWMFYSENMKSFFNYWKKCKKHLLIN